MAHTWTKESAAAALAATETHEDAQALMARISTETGWPIAEECLVTQPNIWHADDGNWEVAEEHESARAAAQAYVDGGEWDTSEGTTWVRVWAWRVGLDECGEAVRVDEDCLTITLNPDEPECTEPDHDWQSPIEIVGGIKENPGVWGHGGGVTITGVCMHCGCEKFTDTWAQNPENGQQGLTSVKYTAGKYAARVEELREA